MTGLSVIKLFRSTSVHVLQRRSIIGYSFGWINFQAWVHKLHSKV